MSNEQIKQILSMGYRKANNNRYCKVWAKPFGNSIFIISEKGHIVNIMLIFKSLNKVLKYDDFIIENNKFSIIDVKEFEERYLKTIMVIDKSEFQFISAKEILENKL